MLVHLMDMKLKIEHFSQSAGFRKGESIILILGSHKVES